mmetsp:Transcript_99500/g.121713  ORF Transcript_99500/g.121713 Transcript_99500/m.121713 type:complete len:438 (+) Transcript_99500:69-1382(+)
MASEIKNNRDNIPKNVNHSQIKIDKLSRNVNESHLKEIFSNFGEIQDIYLAKDNQVKLSLGYGLITYLNRNDAINAYKCMHHGQIDGKKIWITFISHPQSTRNIKNNQESTPTKKLSIKNDIKSHSRSKSSNKNHNRTRDTNNNNSNNNNNNKKNRVKKGSVGAIHHHLSSGSNMSNSGLLPGISAHLEQINQNLLGMFGNNDAAFQRRLRLLDQGSFSREKHKIGIVYCGPNQDDQQYILANTHGSTCYEEFINEIGCLIDLELHEGWDGGLNSTTTGQYCTYYGTSTYEIVFHIGTNMPTDFSDKLSLSKKRHIANDQITIVWCDYPREYIHNTIGSNFNHVHIIIYPLNNGLYRIRIHKKRDIKNFGPLRNNMIITKNVLSILVRLTSLYANRTVRYALPTYTRPFVERKKYLDDALDRNSHNHANHILQAFFN